MPKSKSATLRVLALSLLLARITAAAAEGEWPTYGGDAANTKYSPLEQINRHNVRDLRVEWTWQSVDIPLVKENRLWMASFQTTPLMVDGLLYASTSLSQVVALDPATGEEHWVYDPQSYKSGRPANWGFVHRGVAYWSDGPDKRIFFGTGDGRLIALDPDTGTPIAAFADGAVDVKEGVSRLTRASQFGITSPPAIFEDLVITGYTIIDATTVKEMPPGRVRAYDARTGAVRWTFNTIPREGEFGTDTWEDRAWAYTGSTNVWSIMTVDEELGLLYLPTSTPTSDWYGGQRRGDGLFAESIVCLDARTGKRVWHFQTVHHGVWDYDLPAAPVLTDIEVGGRPIKAVVQISKQGFCYVFDRTTGEPVWPIEERPVPQSRVPGEQTSPTQPFPTKPPPFERQGITEDDLIDFTPELRAEAREIIEPYRIGPLFTPPSLEGTIQLPGSSGGANWGGAAFDPESHVLYVPSITSPIIVRLGKSDPNRSNLRYNRIAPNRIQGPQGLPLLKPPYGRITAIDLNKGEHLWQIANGEGPRNHPLLRDLDLPYLGQVGRAGPLLTRTLLFVADGTTLTNSAGRDGGGPMFRAYDKTTGEILHELQLPANATGTPMTYMHNEKQFILIAVMDPNHPATLLALTLP